MSLASSSTDLGSFRQALEAQRANEWHMHFIINKCGTSAFSKADKELCAPNMELALSAAKPIRFSLFYRLCYFQSKI